VIVFRCGVTTHIALVTREIVTTFCHAVIVTAARSRRSVHHHALLYTRFGMTRIHPMQTFVTIRFILLHPIGAFTSINPYAHGMNPRQRLRFTYSPTPESAFAHRQYACPNQ
jgi:hypothetical protein